ncbi:MAG: relaxase/mobilization nuclease domain-containing protein [Fischerella sp. CENA71]|nr:relaxase/mobilization nuclease domain-containing protein [Fischerella sp. CENA71]
MIGNQTKGKSFRGLLDYLSSREQSSLIGGNMFGTNARELAREFRLSRQLNPQAEKVVHHVSLSLSPGEQLDNDTWCEIADKYMEAMGYTANQYAIYRHNDRDHDHIHICASRISLDDGKITSDSWEYVRSEKIIRQLELEYSLQQTQSSKEKLNRAPSIGQQRRLEREQQEYEQGLRDTAPEQPIKTQLIELIDRATVDKPTMPQLIERLQLLGVEVRHGLTRNGKSKGISYSWNDQKFSGTSLGPAYTFPGLQKHKEIDYQPQRDDERIEQLLLNRVKPASLEQTQKLLLEIEQKQLLTQAQSVELYKYYSAGLEQELVTDRDKKVTFKALKDDRSTLEVEEILKASPAGWTTDEAEALVLIANNQLAHLQEESQQQLSLRQPQFTSPAEDESLWPALQNYLTQKRGISSNLVETLHRKGLGYIDQQRNVVFIKRSLNGEKSGALVWDTHRQDNRCLEYDNTKRSEGWFHINLGGEPESKIERVFLCDSPIDALSLAVCDLRSHKGQPPVKTMYMVVDDPNLLPLECLKNVNRIGLAFNNDSQGNETAQVVQKMLPQAKRIEPSGLTWNEILIEAKQREMLQHQQPGRGFSR